MAILVAGLGGLVPGTLCACALAAATALLACRPVDSRRTRRLWFTGCFFLGWLVLTVLPLPASCAWLAGARRQQFYAPVDRLQKTLADLNAHPATPTGSITAPAALPPPGPVPRHLSLNLPGSLRYLLLAGGAWAMFWLTAAMPDTARRRYLKGLVAGGAAVAALGIAGKYLSPLQALLPWQWLNDYGANVPVWPFVNRNHFATFAALLAPAALFLAIQPYQPRRHRTDPKTNFAHAIDQTTELPPASTPWQHLLFLAAFAVLTVAGFLSLSRGGTVALLLGVLASALYWLPGRRRAATAATVLVMAALVALVLLPATDLQQRLDTLRQAPSDRSGTTRLHNWRDAAGMWAAFPLTGVGMEGFRTVFQLYRTTPSITTTRFAENEYVQLLADGGLVATAFALTLSLLYARCLFARRETSGAPARRTWGIGLVWGPLRPVSPFFPAVLGAAVALAVHMCCDFSVRIPLNAFLAAGLFGLAMPLPPSRAALATPPPARAPRRLAWSLTAVLLLTLVGFSAHAGLGRDAQLDRDTVLRDADVPTLTRALALSPTYWCAWYELGRRLHAAADARQPASAQQTLARDCFARAAACNPMDYRPWWTLAMLQLENGSRTDATDSLARAVALAPELNAAARQALIAPQNQGPPAP